MNKSLVFASALGALATTNFAYAQSQFYIYRSYPTGTQSVMYNGVTGSVTGSGIVTRYVSDDITPLPGYAGQAVSQILWTVVNGNTSSLTVRSRVRFHTANGLPTGPTGLFDAGVYNTGYSFVVTIAASSYTRFTATNPAGLVVPAAPFWMGQTFDNNNNSTVTSIATAAQLLNMGQVIYNPTIGTSTDTMFITPAASVGNVSYTNTATYQTTFVNNTPTANFGFGMAVLGQDFTGTLALNNVGSAAYAKNISYVVTSGTMAITSGVVTIATGTSSTAFTITLPNVPPAGATSSYSIAFDGGQFLKKTINVTTPGGTPVAIPVGTVAMQNGDVDLSGEVDAADIDQVIADFGAVYPGGANDNNDVDMSGEVDAADIDIVIANFGGVDG